MFGASHSKRSCQQIAEDNGEWNRLVFSAGNLCCRNLANFKLLSMPPKSEGSGTSVQVQEAVAQPNLVQIPINIPLPSKLELRGNLATNWKKFHRAWNNCEIAARLKDPENPAVNKSLRTATLLTCSRCKRRLTIGQ